MFKNFLKREKNNKTASEVKANLTNQTICEDEEIKKFIKDWITFIGWKTEDFYEILQLIGIDKNIRLTNFNSEECSFDCITMDSSKEDKIKIELTKSNYLAIISTIKNNTKKDYSVCWRNKQVPKLSVVLIGKCIQGSNGKRLSVECNVHPYFAELKIDENTELLFQSSSRFENIDEIENYLFTLEKDLNIFDVFNAANKAIKFSNVSEFANNMTIRCIQESKSGDKSEFSIYATDGQMTEYKFCNQNEKIKFQADGTWDYINDNVYVSYNKKKYSVNLTGKKLEIEKKNISKIISEAEKKIFEIKKYVK